MPGASFTAQEIGMLSSLNTQPPEMQRAITAKVLRNVSRLDPADAAGVMRFLMLQQQP